MTNGQDSVFRYVPCDLCGARDFDSLGLPRESKQISTFARPPESIAVVRCRRCGFYYTQPMPFWRQEDIHRIYGAAYFPPMTPWWERVKTKEDPRRRLDALQQHLASATPRFLEVGCGLGYGLEEAARRGWYAHGQDVSPFFADRVKSRLGLEVFVGELDHAAYAESSFDSVYIDSVLEHVPQPMRILREVHRILKPGGLAHLTVTNEHAFVNTFRRVLMAPHRPRRNPILSPLAYPVHLVGFTEESLDFACRSAGLDMVQLDVRAGRNEWRKRGTEGLGPLLFSLLGLPIHALGETLGKGIAIEALVAARK